MLSGADQLTGSENRLGDAVGKRKPCGSNGSLGVDRAICNCNINVTVTWLLVTPLT